MNYAMFKEIVADKIISFMPEEFRNYKVVIHPHHKINLTVDELTLISPNREKDRSFPSVYVDDLYEKYQEIGDLTTVLKLAGESLVEHYNLFPEDGIEVIFENDPDKIIMQLINTEQNKAMLCEYPHREIHDLSIIYRYIVNISEAGCESAIINHALAEQIKMTEQELYEAATETTVRLFPPTIKTMLDVMREKFAEHGLSEESMAEFLNETSYNAPMYILSNERNMFGAVGILYDEQLFEIAEKFSGDLYIMPSSIHETIVVSSKNNNPDELAQMVAEINMGQVALEERLSNQVYHYDKNLRKLTVATDTPNHSLSGVVRTVPVDSYVPEQHR